MTIERNIGSPISMPSARIDGDTIKYDAGLGYYVTADVAVLLDELLWQNHTPLLTGSVSDPVLGSPGASQVGRFIQLGPLIVYYVNLQFGTAGGVSAGSGTYRVSLPVTRSSASVVLGSGRLVDNSAGTRNVVSVTGGTGTTDQCEMSAHGTTGPVSSTVPWTWAASDEIRLTMVYEADV